MSNIGPNDLIYYSDNEGKIYSGGFSVNSIMIKEGLSPIMTLNDIASNNQDKSVSSLFSDLVVPSWTLHHENIKLNGGTSQKRVNISDKDTDSDMESDGYISDDLYEKLLGLVSVTEKELKGGKGKTKKMNPKFKKNNNKKTKRRK